MRPKKPRPGSIKRALMDIAEFGETYGFVRDRIKELGGGRGARAEAIRAGAEHFGKDPKTIERHYEKMRPVMEPLEAVQSDLSDFQQQHARQQALIDRAFSAQEQREMNEVSYPFVHRLAVERLELIELRQKRSKRK